VFNNAGVNMFGALDEASYSDWDWVLGVNLGGVINGLQTFVPRIKAHGQGGHIVNTGLMASVLPAVGAGIYTASKFAVRGLTDSLRHTLATLPAIQHVGTTAETNNLTLRPCSALAPSASSSGDRMIVFQEDTLTIQQYRAQLFNPPGLVASPVKLEN
jgi:short-subunit dehydrogenase involved in D-alanine esterification of teichoic acids